MGTWNPAAGFFHFATKDVSYRSTSWRPSAASKRRPAPPGRLRRSSREYLAGIGCRRPEWRARFRQLLLARRTWREFGRAPIALTELATLLQLTWGVHGWIQVPRVGPHRAQDLAFGRSAPQHRGVRSRAQGRGPRPGSVSLSSRYSPAWHGSDAGARQVTDYIPGQHWYKDAGAVMLMTTVFERVQWRYPSRARVSRHSRRGRPSLSDVLPGRDLARTGAFLHDGTRRQPHRERPGDRWRIRVHHLCRRRRVPAEGRRVGAVAGNRADPGS